MSAAHKVSKKQNGVFEYRGYVIKAPFPKGQYGLFGSVFIDDPKVPHYPSFCTISQAAKFIDSLFRG
jgi:hypothetical protein